MKLFVKSRGSLREQDYIYWHQCDAPNQASMLSRPLLNHWISIVDISGPSLLIFSQNNRYHLLVSGLPSARKEPSSPGNIRNTLFITEIEHETEVRAFAIALLQSWESFAQTLDQTIRVDPKSVCGYFLDSAALFQFLTTVKKRRFRSEQRQLPKILLPYGGIGSDSWQTLADALEVYSLPSASKDCHNLVLVARMMRAHTKAIYQLSGSASLQKRILSERTSPFTKQEFGIFALLTVLVLVAFFLWKQN